MPFTDPIGLANELHDGVIQELSALLLQLETCKRRIGKDPAGAQTDIDRITKQARGTLQSLRQLVTRLRAMEK